MTFSKNPLLLYTKFKIYYWNEMQIEHSKSSNTAKHLSMCLSLNTSGAPLTLTGLLICLKISLLLLDYGPEDVSAGGIIFMLSRKGFKSLLFKEN